MQLPGLRQMVTFSDVNICEVILNAPRFLLGDGDAARRRRRRSREWPACGRRPCVRRGLSLFALSHTDSLSLVVDSLSLCFQLATSLEEATLEGDSDAVIHPRNVLSAACVPAELIGLLNVVHNGRRYTAPARRCCS